MIKIQENYILKLHKKTLAQPNKMIGKGEIKIKNITEKAIFGELLTQATGMLYYKEISYDENQENLKV